MAVRRLATLLVASALAVMGLAITAETAGAVGPPSQLVFTVQPGGAIAGAPFTTQPQVTIEDNGGNPVTTDTSAVSLSLAGGNAAANLSGCSSTTSAGVATFAGCQIDLTGTGYTLAASDDDILTGNSTTILTGNSNTFDVLGTITQDIPTSGTTTPTGSFAYTDQLVVSGNNGTVTYTQSTGGADLTVSASGAVTTTRTLPVGQYTATGTMSDTAGDTGSFSYTLTVSAGTITQGSPTSGTTTTTGSSGFSDQLTVSGGNGTVTYTQSTGSADLTVSHGGEVTTPGLLAAGPYTATGTTTDADGDTGTFTYTLTVDGETLAQGSPTSGSSTTTNSSSFTDQLAVGNSNGAVAYAKTGGSSDLLVSATGKVTTTGTLAAGHYTATGTTSDPAGDSGAFSYTLTVTAVTLTQGSPTSGSTTTTGSSTFTDLMSVSGNEGVVSYTKTGGSPDLVVSANGKVATTGALAVGNYTATGTTADPYGDTGSFSYRLTVTAVTLTQGSPTSGSTTTTGSPTFSTQMSVSGNEGAVSYAATGGNTGGIADLVVSTTGKLTTTGGILAVGNYTVTGATSDPAGDSGTFSYTLTVTPATITQASPTSAVVTDTASLGYTNQLNVTGNNGTVTYTQTSGIYVKVSATGAVSTTQKLPPATYTSSGTVSDPKGDTGTFIFVLTVGNAAITQNPPMSGNTTVDGSAAFTAQLAVTGNNGVVTYTQTSGSPELSVSGSGKVTTAGTLAAGMYSATGSTTDPNNDGGAFTFTLTVGPGTITQVTPTAGNTTPAGSSAFTDQLAVSGNNGAVTYAQTGGSAALAVSPTGTLTTTGTLAAGPYTATGTTTDADGDTGTFSYSLTVTAGTITQGTPTAATISTSGSSTYAVQLVVSGNDGAVTYTKNGGSADLAVTSTGDLTTTGALPQGSYTASGTTADQYGDTGTFTFTLTIMAPPSSPPATTPPAGQTNAPAGITQIAPTSGQTVTAMAESFTAQLAVTGNNGAVAYNETTGGASLKVSTTGKVTTTGALSAGTYTSAGTTLDPDGDTGDFSYTLTVTAPVTLAQGGPTSATVKLGSGIESQLAITNANGDVSYTEASSPGSTDVVVTATGAISAAATLAPGTYAVSGAVSDSQGDTGTWTFTLVVARATTTTILELSRAKVTYGDEQVGRLSVIVSSGYTGTAPTGTVAVKRRNTMLCVITLSAGQGSCPLPSKTLGAGTDRLVATYSGDTTFTGSPSAPKALTVAKAASKTALHLSTAKATYGDEQLERLSVTVSTSYLRTVPTGKVRVKEGKTVLCVITLVAGKGSCPLASKGLLPRTYGVVALYAGNAGIASSSSVKEDLTVVK